MARPVANFKAEEHKSLGEALGIETTPWWKAWPAPPFSATNDYLLEVVDTNRDHKVISFVEARSREVQMRHELKTLSQQVRAETAAIQSGISHRKQQRPAHAISADDRPWHLCRARTPAFSFLAKHSPAVAVRAATTPSS